MLPLEIAKFYLVCVTRLVTIQFGFKIAFTHIFQVC